MAAHRLTASSAGLLLDILSQSLDRRLASRAGSHRSGSHSDVSYHVAISLNEVGSPVLDLLGHGQESLLNVGGVLGGRLEEWDTKLICKGLEGSDATSM